MKIKVVATISRDGYLLKPKDRMIMRGIIPGKYGFKALRKNTDLMLHKESSLIALLKEKRQASGTSYLAEVTSDTLGFIKGLFLYRLAEEMILYMLPDQKENGIRLFDIISPSDWILVKEISLKNGIRCFIYHIIN